MPYRQYTQCYQHTVGDKPFNDSDLVSFALGASTPGLIVAIAAFLLGLYTIGFIAIIIQYAATIAAIANAWLRHRLVCISGDQCAVGAVDLTPRVDTLLGAFDNDQFFDIRLMPHRYEDAYRGPNCAYATLGSAPALIQGPPTPGPAIYGWQMQAPPQAGPSLDGLTEQNPANDVFLDGFQGSALLQPGSPTVAPRAGAVLYDLTYDPVVLNDTTLKCPPQSNELARGNAQCFFGGSTPLPGTTPLFTRATLHCEAEGNFWAAMEASSGWQGVAAGGGAAAGAAAGCAIGGWFGPIGCLLGFIIGLFLGAAAGAYVAANAAFNSDPGDVNDANVGDTPLGPLSNEEKVVVYGTHVYDGFHEGWHEFHPLKAILKAPPPETYTNIPSLNVIQINFSSATPYVEWDPTWTPANGTPPSGLTATDMRQGLASNAFTAAALAVKQTWCSLLGEAFDPGVLTTQEQPQNRWTIHPLVDGCLPAGGNPPPLQ